MNKRIMIVDDSRIACAQLKKILKDTEYEVIKYCRNGESAINSYETSKPDLVTMDIIMPDMDGFEAARAILNKWPDAKIVMASSLAYDETLDQAKVLGTKGFIYKPFEKDAVLNAFHKALEE